MRTFDLRGLVARVLVALFLAPQTYAQESGKIEQKGAWIVRCIDKGAGGKSGSCEAIVAADIILQEKRHRAFVLTITKRDAKQKLFNLFIPHEHSIYLPNGIDLLVDGQLSTNYSVTRCDRSGCFLTTTMKAELEQKLKKGARGTVRFTRTDGVRLDVHYSLSGASAALDSVR
ncbi:invasion associated locus B family protein [Ensifer sp. SL37]|uniref:invasion associated locus B family protein n=1 Tax=Ensifer sp. SL37 TaxID=2995137 RepID=UPI002274C856|nr:invasion associated locus B family protein [Ensifer sp. SL37]MCY1740786.1 invasion associated locus B family protein [Ensifer sp. SL37]